MGAQVLLSVFHDGHGEHQHTPRIFRGIKVDNREESRQTRMGIAAEEVIGMSLAMICMSSTSRRQIPQSLI